MNFSDVLAVVSLIVSLAATVITIVGFFASLFFYRDGVKLQQNSNDALAQIKEKAESIQTQVGGMFDRTLNAVLEQSKSSSKDTLTSLHENIDEVPNEVASKITEQNPRITDDMRLQLVSMIEESLEPIKTKLSEMQDTEEDVAESSPDLLISNYLRPTIIKAMYDEDPAKPRWFSASHLSNLTRIHTWSLTRYLRLLKDSGYVESIDEQKGLREPVYRLTKKGIQLARSI